MTDMEIVGMSMDQTFRKVAMYLAVKGTTEPRTKCFITISKNNVCNYATHIASKDEMKRIECNTFELQYFMGSET
jgi:hypothetical protein